MSYVRRGMGDALLPFDPATCVGNPQFTGQWTGEDMLAYKHCVPKPVCASDVAQCADGSFVSRDPQSGCSFRACGGSWTPPTLPSEQPPTANPNPQPLDTLTPVTSTLAKPVSIFGFSIPLWGVLAALGIGVYAFSGSHR